MNRGVLAVLAAMLLGASASPASASEPQTSPAAETLARCVQTNHRLSVVLMVDESESLAQTDPSNDRVDGLRAALIGLARLGEGVGPDDQTAVDVLLAGFYGEVDPDPSASSGAAWESLNEGSLDELLTAAGEYANKNQGRDTDFVKALDGARRLLAEHAADLTRDGGAPPCQALIFFTDGRYSIRDRVSEATDDLPDSVDYAPGVHLDQPGGGAQAVKAGVDLLCKPDGVMDTLVGNGVVTFTVALSSQLNARASGFLQALTTGASPAGEGCGRQTSADTGQFLDVGEAAKLFFAFSGLFEPAEPQTAPSLCPGELCPEGTVEVPVVPGIRSFIIRASTELPEVSLALADPTGNTVSLTPEGALNQSLAGSKATQRWVSDRAVEVSVELGDDPSSLSGPWSFAFVGAGSAVDASPTYTLQLFPSLQPTLLTSPADLHAVRGESTEIPIALEDPAGTVASGELADHASISASVTDPGTGKTTQLKVEQSGAPSHYVATLDLSDQSTAPYVLLGAVASFESLQGAEVVPQQRTFQIPVQLPSGYPSISPLDLHMGSIEGSGTTEATLTLKGGAEGTSCAWIDQPSFDSEPEGSEIRMEVIPPVTSQECLHLAPGESRDLTVRFSSNGASTGPVRASVPVILSSSSESGQKRVEIPATFSLVIQPDVARRLSIVLVLTLVGALIPLLLLHLLNAFAARFVDVDRLVFLDRRVVVTPAGLRLAEGAEVPARPRDFGALSTGSGGRVKELSIGEVDARAYASGSLRPRVFRLFQGPYATGDARGQRLLAGSSESLNSWDLGRVHELPLALAGTWILIPSTAAASSRDSVDLGASDEVGNHVEGRLILLLANDADAEAGSELVKAAEATLRDLDWREWELDDRSETDVSSAPRGGRVPTWLRRKDSTPETGSRPADTEDGEDEEW